MIGKVSGRLDAVGADHVLIDTGGVGYIVYCSERTMGMLPAAGAPLALYTEMVVREDLLQLFGFPSLLERDIHRVLTSVQGVGAKAALAMLGRLGPEQLRRAIAMGDVTTIRKAPGVGPKLAQRVVMELRDKSAELMALGSAPVAVPGEAAMVSASAETAEAPPLPQPPAAMAAPRGPENSAEADALSALVNLGYPGGDAAGAIAASAAEGAITTQELIYAALRRLAPEAGQ